MQANYTCPPSQHLCCSLSHQEKSIYHPLLCTLLLQLTLSYTYVTYVLSMLLLIVCPSSLVILFTVNGSEAISKGSAKIHSFTKCFHPCFLYQGQYYPCGTLLHVYWKRLFNHVISLETGHAKPVFSLQIAGGTSMECLSVPGSRILGEKCESKTHGKSRWGRKVSSCFIFRVCAFSTQRTQLSQSLERATILCVCVSDRIKCFIPLLCYRSKFSVDGLIASSLHNWLSFDQVKSCQWTIIISQQYWFSEVAVKFMLNHCVAFILCVFLVDRFSTYSQTKCRLFEELSDGDRTNHWPHSRVSRTAV